ncbi:hypothetical protein Salat_1744300 [Sesamum alatum]|uniref:Uncharacterized protein n=1 Tax=Sesamum alatum TaxID=300844 RepID=A0AAE1Y9H0_9LAMI|nr:hypothetical protein Salat_1744300 [Sesamum alatum]
MASANEEAFHGNDSSSGTPGTPGSPGSKEYDVPEEFYIFRDLICPELFRDNLPRNTSALQGKGWVAEIMSTPHAGRFYDNIPMTKSCFYALVDALTVRGLLHTGKPHGIDNIKKLIEGDDGGCGGGFILSENIAGGCGGGFLLLENINDSERGGGFGDRNTDGVFVFNIKNRESRVLVEG